MQSGEDETTTFSFRQVWVLAHMKNRSSLRQKMNLHSANNGFSLKQLASPSNNGSTLRPAIGLQSHIEQVFTHTVGLHSEKEFESALTQVTGLLSEKHWAFTRTSDRSSLGQTTVLPETSSSKSSLRKTMGLLSDKQGVIPHSSKGSSLRQTMCLPAASNRFFPRQVKGLPSE